MFAHSALVIYLVVVLTDSNFVRTQVFWMNLSYFFEVCRSLDWNWMYSWTDVSVYSSVTFQKYGPHWLTGWSYEWFELLWISQISIICACFSHCLKVDFRVGSRLMSYIRLFPLRLVFWFWLFLLPWISCLIQFDELRSSRELLNYSQIQNLSASYAFGCSVFLFSLFHITGNLCVLSFPFLTF